MVGRTWFGMGSCEGKDEWWVEGATGDVMRAEWGGTLTEDSVAWQAVVSYANNAHDWYSEAISQLRKMKESLSESPCSP
jgi:hypothetical protein